MSNTATPKQIDFINRLKGEKDLTGEQAALILDLAREAWTRGEFTTSAASTMIDALLSLPKAATEQADAPEVPEGMHTIPFEGHFKVQVAKNGSGRKYAKALVPVETCGGCENCDGENGCITKWGFEYAPGAIHRLSAETVMPAEEAARFGALYGICCNCARDLTDERSIYAGYGPVCAANNGWEWGETA